MQMNPIVDMEYVIIVGTVICQKCCTLADIYHEIMDDELIEYPFDFIIGLDHPLNIK